MTFFRLFITSLGVFLTSISISNGAEFFRKQTGTTTIAAGSTSRTISILSVDMSKSFLVFSSSLNDNSTTNFQVGGEITNATTLTFERTGNTGTVSIKWQVFEFESGVNVQHGSTTNIARNTNVNVTINCIDLTKSFVLVSARKSGTSLGNDDGITANLTTTTNLQFFITGAAGANMEEAYWQVIEYEAAVVKKLTATLNAGATSTTSAISPVVSNLAKTMVISNHGLNADISADNLARTELTNTSTVTYTRNGTTGALNFVTYVIEFTDQTTVTRGTQSFASGSTSQSVGISASSSSGVFNPGNFGRQGSTNYSTDDNTGHVWFTYEISGSTLQIDRAVGTGSTAQAPWQIVTFEDTGLQQSTFYSRATGAWESNLTWSFTPDGSSGAVPTGVYPRRLNNVVIQNGHTVTINNVNDNGPCAQSPDGLGLSNVGPFAASNLTMFYQSGDILIAGTLTVTGIEMMIDGYTEIESGGTFSLTSSLVNLGYLQANSGSTLSSADDLILAGNSTTIINTTSISNDDLIISFTDATLCGSGTTTLQNGSGSQITFANSATINQVCSDFTVLCSGVGCSGFPVTGTGGFISGIIGPGGVGNATDNSLWLRADAGTSSSTNGSPINAWNDQSGNTNNALQGTAAQQPLFQANVINSKPTILFDNNNGPNNDELVVADNNNLDNTAGLTILSVFRPVNLNGNPRAIVSKRAGFNDNQSYSSFFFTGDHLTTDIDLGNNRFASVFTFANNTNYISTTLFDGTLAAASRVRLYVNGGLDVTATESSSSIPNYASNLTIGSLNVSDGRPFGGHIAEVAIYRRALNEAQRIITNNYLSAKYNITISANDVYTMDNAGNGNYDFEVAGIGQASDGSKHLDARGTGVVRMWNPDGLGNNEFLLWGHDNTSLTSSTTAVGTAVDGTIIQERLSRIWRVGESGDVGNVSVSFDFSGLSGSPLGSNLRLLIDRDGDGFADNDVTPVAGSVLSGVAVFSNVNFQNGDRFTLGNTDASMPLPVSLINFTAQPLNSTVLVKWSTESELNNDYFTLQKSQDGEVWEEVVRIPGAGNSSQTIHYEYEDHYPIVGTSYYRLRQTDFDGEISYSPIVKVDFKGRKDAIVYPNPSSGKFVISNLESGVRQQVRVTNSLGQFVAASISSENNLITVDLQDYPAGTYFIQIAEGTRVQTIRAIKY